MGIKTDQNFALSLSTIAFTVCFAVWTIFAIIGVQIKQDMGLNDTQFSLLIGTPILTGSLVRFFLGSGPTNMVDAPFSPWRPCCRQHFFTWCLTYADTYEMMLLTALGVGISGGSFVVGISYLSKWYSTRTHQGTALGVYGMGNIGAAVTKFIAPFVMVSYGWHTVAQVWAIALIVMAVLFWFLTKDEPQIKAQRETLRQHPNPCGNALKTPQKTAGMAVFALLLLCLWRLCCFSTVAAPLLCRRLRHGY
jgi:NNP family nitrate/nitrite transporter-like MFS transporter